MDAATSIGERPSHKRSKSARLLDKFRGTGEITTSKHLSSDASSPIENTHHTSSSGDNLAPERLSPLTATNTKESRLTMEAERPAEAVPQRETGEEALLSLDAGSAPSIEDSVRTFRVFEVLRSKDTAAISKAISENQPSAENPQPITGTTILHLAIQCAEPSVVEQVIAEGTNLDINAQDKEGNTPLHLASQLGRYPVVKTLLEHDAVNDSIVNRQGKIPLDLARTPEIFSQLQLARSLYLDHLTKQIQNYVAAGDYKRLEDLLTEPKVEGALDINALELPTEPDTTRSGGTLLHEAARKRDTQLAQLLLLHGADPFTRDRKGRLPQDVTKDEITRKILKKSPAAAAAQRGIQEKAILGAQPHQGRPSSTRPTDGSKDAREMRGYLKKWTNYTSGYKLRWFVLEDGVLSYYKHQDDTGSACRGAINMRIAWLHMDAQDKTRFEIHGKSSVKYHLKANHVVEAKRWFWSLNNAIQYAKDEVKEEQARRKEEAESQSDLTRSVSLKSNGPATISLAPAPASSKASFRLDAEPGPNLYSHEASTAGDALHRYPANAPQTSVDAEEYIDADDASSHEFHHRPANKDAFDITAQSAKLQIELLSRVSGALKARQTTDPNATLSEPDVVQAIGSYDLAVKSLDGLIKELLKISRDRDAYWQYRLDRDLDARKMWEESMAKIAQEYEDLKKSVEESENKRKRTKRALKEVLEGQSLPVSRPITPDQGQVSDRVQFAQVVFNESTVRPETRASPSAKQRRMSLTRKEGARRKSVIAQFTNLSDSESGDDEEFFDAIDAGEVEVIEAAMLPSSSQYPPTERAGVDQRRKKEAEIEPSYKGYEDGIRQRLKMDSDNRPKISLWAILKSMIGKDMTKMTLPVSFNEPTSLLQRVAEDMEYADLLDIAADRPTSDERMVYVAAFAASEYASTIGRVAKPFNPLLGETYEYVRPDKGYRFFIEQVSHHPPIGAAWAEAPKWDYYGESAVKSKFYGKSFDINPLGTWFLRLRPQNGKAELYTWKKVTSSVVGIITGSPTVDNYGIMQIKNWTTGEICTLTFKQRGWKPSSAYQVQGKVVGSDGVTKWSIGGRWNDKIYARKTEGFEDIDVGAGKQQAVLVWEANPRPTGIPFNLTPFVVTLNDPAVHHIPPTDTRLRPDQRAMEDGEYDLAATEKNRVEEKQRAARRQREAEGTEWKPKWFRQTKDEVTGEMYWEHTGGYWEARDKGDWSACDDIF
ncbi:hypothetical protein DV735_g2553, partial [Chaetothyriales sp. CBS 134920]